MSRDGIGVRFKRLRLSGAEKAAIIAGVFVVVAALIPVLVPMVQRWLSNDYGRSSEVRIARLLPDPPGDEKQNEEATIRNFGGKPVGLAGWKLRDLQGTSWVLDELGMLQSAGQPGDVKTIRRKGQPMGLNNGGDTVELVDSKEGVVDKVVYSQVKEGEEVLPHKE